MASDTATALRQQVMYCVFVRNFSPEGTFEGVRRALPRIRALGTDIVWLMPIHPLGVQARKGALGSPYAVRDYRAVNPEYGTLEDFTALVDAVHAQGMKCIIDVVYNHTSPDSVLAQTHPEWFWRGPDGRPGNRVGDWTDIVDLDYAHPGLWDYQIETLKYWAQWVDGFRCDVAPLVPLDFWRRARAEVARVRPGCLWLAESVEPGFIRAMRARGMTALSDGELYAAFDLTYDYDVFDALQAYLDGRGPLADYLAGLERQESAYPGNYGKLHFLENHDRPRATARIPDAQALRSWTAFLYFMKGTVLLYNGQECGARRAVGLFDRNPIDWDAPDNVDLSPLLRRLSDLRRCALFSEGSFAAREALPGVIAAKRVLGGAGALGVFGTEGRRGGVDAGVPDGTYTNLLDGAPVAVRNGRLFFDGAPVILQYEVRT